MAIHFHEGLPGAGKSYEACVYHILPALKSGRQVVTNIRGVNWSKFAELLEEPEEYIRMLLLYIEPAEQDGDESDLQRVKNEFADKTPDNAMIVWDEIQDYFPSGNYKLPHNQQKFWTEHRHRGLDIVIMGQDRDDVHKIIRSRIVGLVYFLKLEAIGQPDRYKWEAYQKQRKGTFVKIGSGIRSYESKYFGLYMSVRREGVQKSVYKTEKSNVLRNSKALTLGVPFAFLLAGYGVYHLWGFFHQGSVKAAPSAVQVQQPAQPSPDLVNPPPPDQLVARQQARSHQPEHEQKPLPIDYLDGLAQQFSLRATAIIDSTKDGKELLGLVEVLDSTFHVKDRLTVREIRALGWTVTRTGYGLLLEKQSVAYVARPWPIDIRGRVDEHTVRSLDSAPSAAARGATERRSQVPVTVIASGKPGLLW